MNCSQSNSVHRSINYSNIGYYLFFRNYSLLPSSRINQGFLALSRLCFCTKKRRPDGQLILSSQGFYNYLFIMLLSPLLIVGRILLKTRGEEWDLTGFLFELKNPDLVLNIFVMVV